MKKTVALILSVTLIIFSVPLFASASQGDGSFGFAVASDLHYSAPRSELVRVQDDDIYFYANRRASLDDESGFIIDSLLEQCAADDGVECVLVSGDMCNSGRNNPEEHLAVAEKFRKFEQSTGKSVYVVPGNHDYGESSNTNIGLFKEIYAEFGYDEVAAAMENNGSYAAAIGGGYYLIALDSCNPKVSTASEIGTDKLSWVREQCEYATAQGLYPILMMHHNLLEHMPMQTIISSNFIVKNHTAVASLFADMGIKLVFTGHEHCSDAVSYTSAAGNTITDFATTSLTMYPLQYRVFKLTDSEITYTARTVDSIDTAALIAGTAGYTEEMLSLMNSGLNAFAKGFLKKGIELRLRQSLSTQGVGISEGEPFYSTVSTALSCLDGLLTMPLYGEENSLSTKALEYGITIPESGYYNGWELVGELVSAHYAGSESYALDSTEIYILLKTVNLLLKDGLSEVSDRVFLAAANSLSGGSMTHDFTVFCTKLFGSVSAGQYFVVALISPLLYEFAVDGDGTDDNNGTLAGYGTVTSQTRAEALGEKYKSLAEKLFGYILMFFRQLIKAFAF